MIVTVPIRAGLLIKEARERARRRRIRIAMLLIVAGGIAGSYVYSWSPAQSSAPTLLVPDPCTLLSSSQVGSVLGLAVSWRDTPDFGGRTQACRWTTALLSKPQYPPVRRTLIVFVWPMSRSSFAHSATANQTDPITSLGVPAYAIGGAVNELNVWKDGIALQFVIGAASHPLPAAEAVARTALKKL